MLGQVGTWHIRDTRNGKGRKGSAAYIDKQREAGGESRREQSTQDDLPERSPPGCQISSQQDIPGRAVQQQEARRERQTRQLVVHAAARSRQHYLQNFHARSEVVGQVRSGQKSDRANFETRLHLTLPGLDIRR